MALIAQRPCHFGGKDFFIGEEVPEDLVLNPGFMIQAGVLVETASAILKAETGEAVDAIHVVLHREGEELALSLSEQDLQKVFDVLTGAANAAGDIIGAMDSDDALILIHAADGRKGVKTLAAERAKELGDG